MAEIMSKLKIEPMKQPDKIISYWKKDKFVTACIVIFGLLYNISLILGPIYQGKLIDSIAEESRLSLIIRLSVIFVVFIFLIQLFRYFKRFYIRRFANSTSASMRLMIYNHIMHKNASELDNENIGNLMTRAVSDVDLCVEGMRKLTTEVFDTGVMMVTYLILMLANDIKITLISIIFIPIAMMIAEKLKSFVFKYSKTYRNKTSEVADLTYDTIENMMLYRINGIESQNRKRYNNELEDLQNKAVRANILENTMQPIYNVIAMLGIIFVIFIGGKKVIDGGWTIGVFSAYISVFANIASKASKTAKLFHTVQKSQVSWNRIKPYLTEYQCKDMDCDMHVSPAITSNINTCSTKLLVKNLSFCYGLNNDKIIQNINIEGNQGEIIGITGAVASGKSTLAMALTGLYPYLGHIEIDGKELSDYSEYERSQMISYLGHNTQLLSDTIYNNITLGNKKDVTDVINDVCFDIDLKEMEEGLHTLVGNSGVRLSGGQQARAALSRALLNKNKIIILDDPFSAVDMKTEERIIHNIKNNYKESLIILVSHRLAIFDKIDNIILLNNDKTVQYGSHNELMKNSEVYKAIYNLQRMKGVDYDEE